MEVSLVEPDVRYAYSRLPKTCIDIAVLIVLILGIAIFISDSNQNHDMSLVNVSQVFESLQ